MDALVRNWFRRAVGIELIIERWHADSYRVFLDALTTWGDELGSAPEDVEPLVFADETAATGSPWRQDWWPRPAVQAGSDPGSSGAGAGSVGKSVGYSPATNP